MGRYSWLKDGNYFISAEYCPGLFGFAYMGWWLYASPIIEGRPDTEQAVWLNCDWELDAVMAGLGFRKPPAYIGKGHTEYIEAFRSQYPSGVMCAVKGFGYCCKIEIMPKIDLIRQKEEASPLCDENTGCPKDTK